MNHFSRLAALASAGLFLVIGASADTTVRASTSSSGAQGDGDSALVCGARISRDGQYVVFRSVATNLTGDDTHGNSQIYRKNLATGVIELVSVGASGGANGNCFNPSVSADGRYVTFSTGSSDLVANDFNGQGDVFLRDMQTGITRLVSIDGSGTQGNLTSDSSMLSADGRYVAFRSLANNWGFADSNGDSDIFVKDLVTGAIKLVSVNAGGTDSGSGYSGMTTPEISDDGRYVAFSSAATNLVAGDTNGRFDVFRRDLLTQTTIRVSLGQSGAQGNGDGFSNAMSADGRYIAFSSWSTNLVSKDTNGTLDVFVRDCQSNTTERVSVDSTGKEGNGKSGDGNTGGWGVSISANGRYVAFQSEADNLLGKNKDTNNASDVFVRDRQLNKTTRESVTASGAQGNGASTVPSLSGDGSVVMFVSGATNLVSGDTNGKLDVFVRG